MATYWENSCSFGLRYFSWYKYLIVYSVFYPPRFLEWESYSDCAFPDLCLLVPFNILSHLTTIKVHPKMWLFDVKAKKINSCFIL